MKGEWCIFNSYFTPAQCDEIVTMAHKLAKRDASMGVGGETNTEEYRRSKIAFIQKDMPQFKALFDKLWELSCWANNDWFDFHISKFDYIQFAEYSAAEKSEYKTHCDVFWLNNDPRFHRKLSMVVQLTDPGLYTGGELQLQVEQAGPADQFRNQGTVILFPSFVNHAVTPMQSGQRNSLAIWIDGPKWR